MAYASIPVDVFNPGQVFACLGLAEAAEVLHGGSEAGFDWSDEANARFSLWADGADNPLHSVLDFLGAASVLTTAPSGSANDTARWDLPTVQNAPDAPFPFPDPDSPATLPAVLEHDGRRVVVDHWGDTQRDNVKFWAGAGGYPGAALLRDGLDLVRTAIRTDLPRVAVDPFALSAPQSSSLRLDWRRDYVPLDAGFSLNEHPMEPRGYPLVEILAAIGLTHARPERPDLRDKLAYRYGIIGRGSNDEPHDFCRVPLLFGRAALGCASLPWPTRRFRMALKWPGQENQARCITTVTEENHL